MSATPVLADAEARRAISEDLDATLVIEAAAGTGKTTELVRRIVRVVASGRAAVDQIVAVTFTEKAAGELKLRLRQALEHARRDAPAEQANRLERALRSLEDAHVSTIHGFCAELLRERPVEAGVDPLFSVLTEAQARRLYDEAFQAWFHEALEQMPDGVRRSLRRPARGGANAGEDGPVERLERAGWALADWRDFPSGWERPAWTRADAVAAVSQSVHALAEMRARASSTRDPLFTGTAAVAHASADLRIAESSGDLDGAEARLVELSRDVPFRNARKGGRSAMFGPGLAREDVYARHQALVAELDELRLNADADLAALLRDELRGAIDRYESLKRRQGALDFLDLLLRARDLVRDCDEARDAFQRRFARIFVDEFQDTDPVQAEILLLLAADDPGERDASRSRPAPGKLFVVGDPKQSIYRFRRADVSVYRDVCEQLERCGGRRAYLTTSFRSVPNIQRAVNAAFSRCMVFDRDTLQADYTGLDPWRPAIADQPSVVALPVPRPYGGWKITGRAIEASLPDATGAFVDWLVRESGWMVTERRAEQPVPVQARHVCILFRRFVNFGTDVTRAYVDALEARGIRHLLVGGRSFHDREEIETVRAALAAIEWPDDELSVFAALRGALFAIGDEELLEYRHAHARSFHPFRVPEGLPSHLQPIGDALGLLAELHARRNRRPVAETITRLFDETRAHVGFALRRAGEQALANALHVAELARQYELSGGLSFRGFVDELREAADDGQAAEAPIVEEGTDGVRLMTVHKAKGLEFPVVILADMTAKIAAAEASRHLDASRGLCAIRFGGWSPSDLIRNQVIEQARDREEGVRVAYVAATRARDLLVVPAVGDEPYDGGWASPLNGAIYPPVADRRSPLPARRCPAFKKDSVLSRPDDRIAMPQTVAPGAYRLGGHVEIVWWDPAALGLGAEPPFGLRRQELISKDATPETIAAGEKRYLDWRASRQAAIDRGRQPSLEVSTATEWAGRSDDVPEDVDVIALDVAPGRPGGARFGTLVHAVLATAPLDGSPAVLRQILETDARIVGATAEETAAAFDTVRAAMAHPLLAGAARALASGRCYREMPVTIVEGTMLVEGVIDLAFETDDGLVVVDFKTDRPSSEVIDRYRRQVSLYARALASAVSMPVRACILQV
jgi:ATP-dependent exoDNAse (exonuclease V) beta subunit